ncbi:protein FAR1-RELATED SEQUENCE 5-like [Tripterygium wilfordii]|uniref:protein FAR1-RELATED SEQUENCE 5-like n=1 Tax=Tripterygium wilfordii TaxID=458696 RepID=UPI0018F8482B|nr:protein FAR1-RELATED SEQUENCE 5-like [Tripterygium wilfordii]
MSEMYQMEADVNKRIDITNNSSLKITSLDLDYEDFQKDYCVDKEVNYPEKIIEEEGDGKPKIGMEFVNLAEAWEFWKKYGKFVGFGVRKDYINRSKKDGCVLVQFLFVAKKVKDRRTNGGLVNIVLDRGSQKYKIKNFVEEHNHELEPPETHHMIRSHREVGAIYGLAIELTSDSGLTPRATPELLCKEVGGGQDLSSSWKIKGVISDQREKKKYGNGELGNIVKCFEEKKMKDHGFFYSMQFDSDELVTNLFWSDLRMIVDYVDFGDVLTFDTTCGTNKELRLIPNQNVKTIDRRTARKSEVQCAPNLLKVSLKALLNLDTRLALSASKEWVRFPSG